MVLILSTWAIKNILLENDELNEMKKESFKEKKNTTVKKEKLKVVTVLTFIVVYSLCISIMAYMMAFAYSIIPKKMMLVNDKVVLYSGADYYLTAGYHVKEGYIFYNMSSLEIRAKDGAKISFTARVILTKTEK